MNGENFILYTTHQGGFFAWKKATREQYDEAVETGRFGGDKLAFVAFGTIEDNYDFRLQPAPGPREKVNA